jgi:hypothetical protein
MTPDQARMLTALAIASRPNGARRWDSAGVMAALKAVADRSLPEVILATIRAAADRNVDSPGVIPTNGPHWAESAAVRPFVPEPPPPCHCGQPHREKAAPDVIAERVAALKAELAPTAGPTERRSLEDLAAANPELHERLAVLRAANPGLATPSLRETETTERDERDGAA